MANDFLGNTLLTDYRRTTAWLMETFDLTELEPNVPWSQLAHLEGQALIDELDSTYYVTLDKVLKRMTDTYPLCADLYEQNGPLAPPTNYVWWQGDYAATEGLGNKLEN